MYLAATRREFGGVKFGVRGGRRRCRKCGQDLTCEHKYARCAVTQRVWGVMLKWWERATSERLDPKDEWVTLWGARWADDGDHPREEVFRVMHACVVTAIHQDGGGVDTGRSQTQVMNAIVARARTLMQQVAQARRQESPRAFEAEWAGIAKEGAAQVRILWEIGDEGSDDELPPVEIYTDGSAGAGKAGYGFVVVRDGTEVACESGPVRYGARTNNVGEMLGIQKAVEWATAAKVSVTIRYDSKYAEAHARGRSRVRKNAEQVSALRGAVRAAKGVIKVGWKHVKGHSGDAWNDRADALAKQGAEQCSGTGGQTRRSLGDPPPGRGEGRTWGEGAPRGGAPASGGRVRWVTGTPTEADRIKLSRTRHGCLNTVATRYKDISRAEISRLRAKCIQRIRKDVAAGVTTTREAAGAMARLESVRRELAVASVRRRERADRRAPRITREVWCEMNATTLEILAETDGVNPVVAAAASADLRDGQRMEGDGIRVVRAYTFAPQGRDLYEAGHITGCREMAVGGDPFKWDKQSRRLAFLMMGAECDDRACYPRARMAMTEVGRRETRVFLTHRERILEAVGKYLFAEVPDPEERRARAKAITSAYDMDSALDAWARTYGNPHGRTLRGHTVALRGGGVFSMEAYRRAQASGTAWMESRLTSMVDFIRAGRRPGSREYKKAGRTAKSYVLQEAEATARNAKVAWCYANGLRVTDLQHDGIMVAGIQPGSELDVAAGMEAAAKAACGFDVGVDIKQC